MSTSSKQHEITPGHAAPPRSRTSQRVADFISERIRSGEYRPGTPLPTERTLAADLRVHRRAVRMAVEQLVTEGQVLHKPNCRAMVGDPKAAVIDTADHRSPRLSSSNLVALIMWHGGGPLEHAGTSQQRIFWGINQALKGLGYHAVFLDLEGCLGTDEANGAQEAAHLKYVMEQRFGGVVFYPYAYRRNADLVREVARHVPLVLLDRKIEGVDVDFVGVENKKAMYDVTAHLLSLGHRRIAHVTHVEPIHSVVDRALGYTDAMRDHEDAASFEAVITLPRYSDERQWIVFDAIFSLPADRRPTAAVCLNDYCAVSIADRLEKLGLSIQRDVAITGFDNIVPTLPGGLGLTTLGQPFEGIGSKAVELLMRRIKDPHAPAMSVELPVQLVIRGSSGG